MPDKQIKILLVDGDEEVRIALKDLFEQTGFKTFAAGEADIALEILKIERPQICLIEAVIRLPYTYPSLFYDKGLMLIRKMKEIQPCAKFIAFASAYKEVLYLAKEFGADDVIKKPSEPRIILDKLNILALEFSLQGEKSK